MDTVVMVIRFLMVFILTFIYGLQRQRSHKPIGFGTFILVAIGSCGLAITAVELGISNSLPLLGAIVTGIGFLGAGALIRTSDKIFGFTTAASVWLFAIFGMIIGLGMYLEAGVIYALVWIVIFSDSYLEKRFLGSYRRELTVKTQSKLNKENITEILSKYCKNFKLIRLEMNRKTKETVAEYLIEGMKKNIESLLNEFYRKPWCTSIDLS